MIYNKNMLKNIENEKQKELNKLFSDWANHISTKEDIVFQDDNISYPPLTYFTTDGFFPGYWQQKTKILIIARETRYNAGQNIITNTINNWKEGKYLPTNNSFWGKIIDLIYGIQNQGIIPFEKLPKTTDIAQNMIKSNNYGFAFMEVSKYSNDSDTGGSKDKKLINQFLIDSELQKRNFIAEEIDILEPNLILTANLWDGTINNFDFESTFENWEVIKDIPRKAILYETTIHGKKYRLIDLYHFSAVLSEKEYFYEPVMNLLLISNYFER